MRRYKYGAVLATAWLFAGCASAPEDAGEDGHPAVAATDGADAGGTASAAMTADAKTSPDLVVDERALSRQVEKRRDFEPEVTDHQRVVVDHRRAGTVDALHEPLGQCKRTTVFPNPEPSQYHMRQIVPPRIRGLLQHRSERGWQSQSIAIQGTDDETVGLECHCVPILGLQRVIAIGDASKHAPERRLFRLLDQHSVVTLQGSGELLDAEAPVHHGKPQQGVRLARLLEEVDRVGDCGIQAFGGPHEITPSHYEIFEARTEYVA